VTNQAISLEAVWGAAASSLRERLAEAATPEARIRILEQCLLGRLRGSSDRAPALRMALEAFEDPHLESVAEVNRRTGLSPKKLLALFGEEIGLTPKAYWRVRRFRAALKALGQGRSGAAVACEYGYADQSHFLREFKAIAGSSPGEYLARRVIGTDDHVSLRR
jgi:AraC-like DNA-binding protein